MSGFEIVGVVLGSFSLILETANGLRGVLKDVKTWWQFETEFEDFVSAIEKEYIAYSQNLEILLEPLDISEDDREILQNDPDSPRWHGPQIQADLRRRIQPEYHEWYMSQLWDVNYALKELHSLLPVGRAYDTDATSLERQMFRLKRSFSHRKDKLLSRVKDGNEAMYRFLDRASHLAGKSSPQHRGPQTRGIRNLQEQARYLYNCFRHRWTCNCGSGHPCGITAQKEVVFGGEEAAYLKVLFNDDAVRTQVKIEVDNEVTEPAQTTTTSTESGREDVTRLKQQMSAKSRLTKVKKKESNTLVALAGMTLTAIGNFSSVKASSPKMGKRKMKANIKDFAWIRRQGGENECNPSTTTPSGFVSKTKGMDKPSTRVRFAEAQGPILVQQDRDLLAITDMCHAIRSKGVGSCLGFLEMDQRRRILLHLDPPNQTLLRDYQLETVNIFIDSTPRRETRLRIGLATAFTILSLGASSWIPPTWSKSELFILRTSDSPVPQPYLYHASLRDTLLDYNPATAAEQARTSLFALGVLLLELLYRESLESQPFRAEYVSNTGQASPTTDLCTALRWHERVEEDFGDRLAKAIFTCLVCGFDSPDLGSSAFVQAVWQNVVRPVEEFLSAWSTSPIQSS